MTRLILANPFSNDGLMELDLHTGEFQRHSVDKVPKINGNMYMASGHLLALYADGDSLFLQMDNKRWLLDDPSLSLSYRHDFSSEMTSLTAKNGVEEAEVAYPAWWKGLGVKWAVLPELDEDQDYAAYVCAVWRNEELRHQLLDVWKVSCPTIEVT